MVTVVFIESQATENKICVWPCSVPSSKTLSYMYFSLLICCVRTVTCLDGVGRNLNIRHS